MPFLVPLRHLDGYHVWIGNDLAGACWNDRWGSRWVIRWNDHSKPFKCGYADDLAECVKAIVVNR